MAAGFAEIAITLPELPIFCGLFQTPFKPMKEMRGFLKGIDTTVLRDEDRV